MERSIPSGEVLRLTSRTFALSIRLLPPGMREPVRIAYLLARTADTVADRGELPHTRRDALLDLLAGAVREGSEPPELDVAAPGGATRVARAESILLGSVREQLAALCALPAADRADAASVVRTLIATMRRELEQFAGASPDEVVALPDGAALTAYTEGIAGCVGEFWTSLVGRHACRIEPRRRAALVTEGRRFGRGLQLVNVLRDAGADAARGRCFLPATDLAAAGLEPRRVLDPAAASELRRAIEPWVGRARRGLLSGLVYASNLPRAGWRVRLATCLPAAIGLETLDKIASDRRWPDPAVKVSVTRGRVRGLVLRSAVAALSSRGVLSLGRLGAA